MRDVLGNEVSGEYLDRALDGCSRITLAEHLDPGLVPVGRYRRIVLQDLLGGVVLRLGSRPGDLERIFPLARRFDRLRDDADTRRQRHDFDDTRDGLGAAVVDLLRLLVLH